MVLQIASSVGPSLFTQPPDLPRASRKRQSWGPPCDGKSQGVLQVVGGCFSGEDGGEKAGGGPSEQSWPHRGSMSKSRLFSSPMSASHWHSYSECLTKVPLVEPRPFSLDWEGYSHYIISLFSGRGR